MVVGHTYDVRAALSLGSSPPDVTFEGPTTVVVVDDIGCVVEATLTGPDFVITPERPQTQSFTGGGDALMWEWQVRPTVAGDDLRLALRLQAEFRENGETVPGPQDILDARIDVDADAQPFSDLLIRFFNSNFVAVIVGVVAGPLVGLGVARLRVQRGRDR
jgi:hypothetical protein